VPSPKRWFPVSHELPTDPEMYLMMKVHGPRFVMTWLWILSRIDQSDNSFRWPEDTVAEVSRSLHQSAKKVRRQLHDVVKKGWLIVLESTESGWPCRLATANYLKYHRPQDVSASRRSSFRHPLLTPSEPSEPIRSEPKEKKKKDGIGPLLPPPAGNTQKSGKIESPSTMQISSHAEGFRGITGETLQWAWDRGWADGEIQEELECMEDHYRGKGQRIQDRSAMLRVWLRKAKAFAKPKPGLADEP